MKTERRASTGPPARRATPRLALIALALAAIGLEGCQSIQSINPFRNCVGCGPLSRMGNGGLFNRNRARIVYEEPPILVDPAPGVEVLPGAPAIVDPGPPMGSTLIPADPALTTPAPSIRPPDDRVLELEPLPEPSGRAPQNPATPRVGARTDPGARPIDRASAPSAGDPYADRMARRSSDEAPARFGFDPAPAPGRPDPSPTPTESLRVIDSLPAPEAIGREGLDAADSAPPPPTIAPGPQPAPESSPSPPAVADPPAPPAEAPRPEPSPPAVADPEPPPAPAASESPPESPPAVVEPVSSVPESQPNLGSTSGIGAFYSVAPLLAGGAVPDAAGWSLLADRGYRTVLDLRPIEQVRPADFASSSRLGLRHIPLPMTPGVIDAAIVSRFEEELALDSSRPIFFCDADGSGAAALWFVHRVAVDRADPERARRDAERIAPIPPPLMHAARAYLDGQHLASEPASEPLVPPSLVEHPPTAEPEPAPTAPAPAPESEPSAPTALAEAPSAAAPAPAEPIPSAPAAPAEATVAEVFEDPFARPAPIDPKGWGPYAALFLSILVVPLAYWGSATLPHGFRTRARASLAAPERRPRSLPTSSDA